MGCNSDRWTLIYDGLGVYVLHFSQKNDSKSEKIEFISIKIASIEIMCNFVS